MVNDKLYELILYLKRSDTQYFFSVVVHCIFKTTLDRVVPYWMTKIAPVVASGKKVLIAAHGNSLRALVKYLDDIPDNEITEVNIPTAVPVS